MPTAEKPVPSKEYQRRQRELWRLMEFGGPAKRNAALSVEEQLEAEFVQAWGLSKDPKRVSRGLPYLGPTRCAGLDHCTFYYDPETGCQVVVTQPYLEDDEVLESLTTHPKLCELKPEIVLAHEWTFYYPGETTLWILKFPCQWQRRV